MRKPVVYWIPRIHAGVVLAALLMLASAVLRMIWAGMGGLASAVFWQQVILPLVANVSFLAILFRDSRARLFRLAIPVWLGCVFFALKALTFDSQLHTVLCLLLYAVVAILFTATVIGRVPTMLPLIILFTAAFCYHVFVEDLPQLGVWGAREWLAEGSVLCCIAALLVLCLICRKKELAEGEYRLRFGDRNDGRRLRKLSPIFAVSPYLMKTRNTSHNMIADHIEITAVEKYIREKREAGMKNFGLLHVLLSAYVRTCAQYPALNRFVSGQKIFTRDREIEVNMTIKKEMTADSPDTVIKVAFDPADTPEKVYEKFNIKVQEVKDAPLDSGFDKLAGVFNLIPGLLLKFLVFLLETMDYFGLLPRFLTRLSPFHGSLYVTSMGSLGIPPIYHHLYDFGNVPVFCALGRKRKAYEIRRDGRVVLRKYVDCNYVTDERIVDGFYFAACMKQIHTLMSDPWLMDEPVEEVLRDQD